MTTTMQEFEYVSIAMDGEELSDEILDKLLADDEAAQKWYEYHLISDCMKQKAVVRDADFMQSAAFKASLAEISAEHRHNASLRSEPVAQVQAANHTFKLFAAAASIAAVAVSIWQFWPSAQQEALPVAAGQVQPDTALEALVNVSATADSGAAASAPVMPNAAKERQPVQQPTVGTEGKVAAQQTVVQ